MKYKREAGTSQVYTYLKLLKCLVYIRIWKHELSARSFILLLQIKARIVTVIWFMTQ